jgi:hypothetical protein
VKKRVVLPGVFNLRFLEKDRQPKSLWKKSHFFLSHFSSEREKQLAFKFKDESKAA